MRFAQGLTHASITLCGASSSRRHSTNPGTAGGLAVRSCPVRSAQGTVAGTFGLSAFFAASDFVVVSSDVEQEPATRAKRTRSTAASGLTRHTVSASEVPANPCLERRAAREMAFVPGWRKRALGGKGGRFPYLFLYFIF